MKNKNQKLAIIFPGIGYHVDKPLLYYARKIATSLGYTCICVSYPDLSKEEIKNRLQESIQRVMKQVEEQLSDVVDMNQPQELLFISKSIGSVVSAEYRKRHNLKVPQVIYTPIQETLTYGIENAIVFHGTNDSWCNTEDLKEVCVKNNVSLQLLENANHSLEIEDVIINIEYLKKIMETTKNYLEEKF